MSTLLHQPVAFFRRNPFTVACTALGILLWIANYFIWTRHQELSAGHQTLQRNGEDMLQALTGHSRVTTELAVVKEAIDFINANLVHEGDLPENMGYFYQLEASSRIRLESLNQLSSAPASPDQAYKTVPFALRTTGSYRQILRFLRELEVGPRLYRVQTYSLAQAGSVGDTAQVTLDLNLEMLAQP